MYQWRKGIASWQCKDTLYISVPFTWLMPEAEKMAQLHKGPVLIGGPGTMKPTACEGFDPLMFHNPSATFTTRGCPNHCSFCAVPKIEGEFREIPDFRPAPVICDNNLLAASRKHLERVVERLKAFPLVDFNQGLEARRFTPEVAERFGYLRCKVRFAFDSLPVESEVKAAVDLCRERTSKDIGIYVLIGYKDTPEEALYRLETVRSWGIRPNPMRYQPLDAKMKNSYVAPGWTDFELKKMMTYYSRLRWFEHIPYSEYEYASEDKDQLELSFEGQKGAVTCYS
jgi:hypothetical protein